MQWTPPFAVGDVLLQAPHPVVVRQAFKTHTRLLHDPARADILRHDDRHDAFKTDLPEAVSEHGDCRFRGVTLIPGRSYEMLREIDFRPGVLVHRLGRPDATLPHERACGPIFDGPHRIAKFTLHRVP